MKNTGFCLILTRFREVSENETEINCQKAESSIVDCQDQDDVAEEKVNQIDLRGKMWDAYKRGYHFYQEKAFQEGSVQGTTCGS